MSTPSVVPFAKLKCHFLALAFMFTFNINHWFLRFLLLFSFLLTFLIFIFLLNAGFRWAVWGTLAWEWHYSEADHLQGIQPAYPAERQRGKRSLLALRALLHRRRRNQLQVKLFSLAKDFNGFLSFKSWNLLFWVSFWSEVQHQKSLGFEVFFGKLINDWAWHTHR